MVIKGKECRLMVINKWLMVNNGEELWFMMIHGEEWWLMVNNGD